MNKTTQNIPSSGNSTELFGSPIGPDVSSIILIFVDYNKDNCDLNESVRDANPCPEIKSLALCLGKQGVRI